MNKIKLLIIILILDYLWIIRFKGKIINYDDKIKAVQGRETKLTKDSYIKFFILYTLIVYLIDKYDINNSYLDKFMLGISVYGIFNLTNSIIFEKWDYQVVITDTLWGGILFCLATFIEKN